MTQLIIPAPNGWKGLAFGATTGVYSPGNPHKGQDWGYYYEAAGRPPGISTTSKKVVAPVSGTVTTAYSDGKYHDGWGNHIIITVNSRVKVRLAHFSTVKVKAGQKVSAGQHVGQMGQTGNTQGIHLHEELLIDGVRVNPGLYRVGASKHLPDTTTGTVTGTPKPTPTPAPTPAPEPAPTPAPPEEEDDDMPLHTVHARADKTNGTHEGDWTLSDPDAGKDLLPFDPKKGDKTRMRRTVYSDGKGGVINEYRGFYATNIRSVFLAWARTWAKGGSQIHSVTVEADYQTIQAELSRVATKN